MSDASEKRVQDISRRGVLQAAATLVAVPFLMNGLSGIGKLPKEVLRLPTHMEGKALLIYRC